MTIPLIGLQLEINDGLNIRQLGDLPNAGGYDGRLQAQQLGELLLEQYEALPEPLSSYTVTKTVRNLDINTQRFSYEINIDMAISATVPAPEPAPIVE